MPKGRLPYRAWIASMRLQKNHNNKIMCIGWGTNIRKSFNRWKVESYLTMPPEKVNIQEFQISLLNTLQAQWLTIEKRTKLEYYQDQINPSYWSTYMSMDVSAQTYINTPIPLLYRRYIYYSQIPHKITHISNQEGNLVEFAKTCQNMQIM